MRTKISTCLVFQRTGVAKNSEIEHTRFRVKAVHSPFPSCQNYPSRRQRLGRRLPCRVSLVPHCSYERPMLRPNSDYINQHTTCSSNKPLDLLDLPLGCCYYAVVWSRMSTADDVGQFGSQQRNTRIGG